MIPKVPVSSYFNQTVVLYNSSVVTSKAVNLKVRWEDETKEIVDENATYIPVNAVVSTTLLIYFNDTDLGYYFVKDGKYFDVKVRKMVPKLDGTVDYYSYGVAESLAPVYI